MSTQQTSQQIPQVPWWVIGLGVGVSAVIVGGVILYEYFVAPGNQIVDQYQAILADIYNEAKQYLLANAQLNPPVYGLTADQQLIINGKTQVAQELEPLVLQVLQQRGETMWDVLETVAIGIAVGIGAVGVSVAALIYSWRSKQPTASDNIESAYGQSHMLFEMLDNEMALDGNLNIASGFLQTIQTFYSTYTQPALTTGINYYQTLLPTLVPNSLEYIAADDMLTFMQFEINTTATTGIMGVMWTFWYPPLI